MDTSASMKDIDNQWLSNNSDLYYDRRYAAVLCHGISGHNRKPHIPPLLFNICHES